MNEYLSLSSSVLLMPRRAGLRDGEDNVVEILLRVQAPDAPPADTPVRPPQALALVIDRSGSMSGQPLAEAVRAASHVAARLRANDSVSVVEFDHRVRCLLPAIPLGDGEAVRQALAGIQAGGNTDLHGGWREGARTLEDLPPTGLRRVILLSDGCANAGETNDERIVAEVQRLAAQGITTSTYGLGRNFNEDLMVAMGRAGGGNSYYGERAEDLHEPFERELDLLANLCLQRVTASVQVPDGVEVTWLNDLPVDGEGRRLPDLAWGAEAWAVLRLTAPRTSLPAVGRSLPVLRVEVTAQTLDGEPVRLERTGLSLTVLPPAEFDLLPQDRLVLRRLAELKAAQLLARMGQAARHGAWDEVDALLQIAEREFVSHEWLHGMLRAMQELARGRDRERTAKEARYSERSLQSRLAAKEESMWRAMDANSPAYLRRKDRQGRGQQ
jgi:Ca-activated chloride channel family protein